MESERRIPRKDSRDFEGVSRCEFMGVTTSTSPLVLTCLLFVGPRLGSPMVTVKGLLSVSTTGTSIVCYYDRYIRPLLRNPLGD